MYDETILHIKFAQFVYLSKELRKKFKMFKK